MTCVHCSPRLSLHQFRVAYLCDSHQSENATCIFLRMQPLNWDKTTEGKRHVSAGLCGRTHWCLSCCLTEALAKVCLFVDEDFGRDHISERHEHLQYVLVSKFLGQVVDEQVGTFGTWQDEMQGEGKVRVLFHLSKTAGEWALHCGDRHRCAVVIGTELKHT